MPNTNSPQNNGHLANSQAIDIIRQNLAKRQRAERRFRLAGRAAIGFALFCLVAMLSQITWHSRTAFFHSNILVPVQLSPELLEIEEVTDPRQLSLGNYEKAIQRGLEQLLGEDAVGQANDALVSSGAIYQLQEHLQENPLSFGKTAELPLLADDDVDLYIRYHRKQGRSGRLSPEQVAIAERLLAEGKISIEFNPNLFLNGDSREPELAGLGSAIMGSLYALLVCFAIALPMGVASALYLELYAPQNSFTRLIEININNLAAVPSIIFGLLGLAIFINFFGMPKAWPVVGGMVLALMTLPTIIIASRAAIRAVPKGIIEGAEALGASRMQVIIDHILPHAMPGILTGTIIGLAQALGETAPLLLIGMVAFVVDVPQSLFDPATALPVQIFLWSDSPERAFLGKTAGAILVLLAFLVCMNLSAILLRRKYEKRNAGH